MYTIGNYPSFWFKLVGIALMVGFSIYLFEKLVRSFYRLEKRKVFSYGYINDKHKKIDWIARIVFIICMLIGVFINGVRDFEDRLIFLEPYFLLISLVFITEMIRIYMEWKYVENRNAYKAT